MPRQQKHSPSPDSQKAQDSSLSESGSSGRSDVAAEQRSHSSNGFSSRLRVSVERPSTIEIRRYRTTSLSSPSGTVKGKSKGKSKGKGNGGGSGKEVKKKDAPHGDADDNDSDHGPMPLCSKLHMTNRCCAECCNPSLKCEVCGTMALTNRARFCVVCDQLLRCSRCSDSKGKERVAIQPADRTRRVNGGKK